MQGIHGQQRVVTPSILAKLGGLGCLFELVDVTGKAETEPGALATGAQISPPSRSGLRCCLRWTQKVEDKTLSI